MKPTYDQLCRKVTNTDDHVATLLYHEMIRQLEFEHRIRDKLERKATVLLSLSLLTLTLMIGLSLSISFLNPTLALIFGLMLLSGLGSGFLALVALRAGKDIQQADFEDVFHPLSSKLKWHQWMTMHVYTVVEKQNELNERRASWLRKAFLVFGLYVLLMALFGGMVLILV